MSGPLLAVRGVTRAFGGVEALAGVSFDVAAGERVALIGPNGAGKTTCFNVLGGQLAPDRGDVQLAGQSLLGLAADAIARRRVGRTFQVAATFASMTVRENVEVALRGVGRDAGLARATLERAAAADLADRHAGTLAYGDAKRVEFALALAVDPVLLLMDEPTAGMLPRDRRALMDAVRMATAAGIAVLFTEHDMDVVFGYADRIIVLDRGRVLADAAPDAVRADPRVQAVYLGEDAA
ncbi:MAG: ABC transporter ATP-binding protein [Proteobacteria bacterium]|nr:ABC transporter ATP-binding protein [Pseudomonadota bacterium]